MNGRIGGSGLGNCPTQLRVVAALRASRFWEEIKKKRRKQQESKTRRK
jgi:hypothetical protein